MQRTTLVQHVRHQERINPGATGEFTSLMNEIMVASKIVSLEVNKAGIGEDILGLTGKINVQGEEVQKLLSVIGKLEKDVSDLSDKLVEVNTKGKGKGADDNGVRTENGGQASASA